MKAIRECSSGEEELGTKAPVWEEGVWAGGLVRGGG